MTDPRIEAAARALCEIYGHDPDADEAMVQSGMGANWRAYEDEARVALAAADAAAWRPIETAPRDKEIVLFYPKAFGSDGGIHKGRWDCDQYRKMPKPYWRGSYSDCWGVIHARKNPPTHWRPVYAPPEGEVQGSRIAELEGGKDG